MDHQHTAEAIAFTEKKVSMALDDIIKMSKKKNSRGKGTSRQPIKKRQNNNSLQGASKVKAFMDSRSSIRQGVLAQRRSNFNGNQFPATSQMARRAAGMPIRNRAVRWNKQSNPSMYQRGGAGGKTMNKKKNEMLSDKPRTMDALFAHMKEQRMKTLAQPARYTGGRQFGQQRQFPPRQSGPQRQFQQRPGRYFTGPSDDFRRYD